MFFFVNEFEDNTSQKNDGNVGGQKFVVGKNEWALIHAPYADKDFMVLGFTTADGNPVCCVIILAGSESRANHILGCQPWANVDGDASDIHKNSQGLDKFYPCGPKFTQIGKGVDTFFTMSEHESIDNEILTLMMQHLNRSLQLDQSEAIHPFYCYMVMVVILVLIFCAT
jgi:hypothetical protein